MELIVFTLSLSMNIYIYELDMLRHQRIYFSIADVRVGIRTDPVLRNGIKFAVVA